MTMRCFVIAMLVGGARLASADTGVYASVSGGMAQYGGDLASYDDPSNASYTTVNDVEHVALGLSLRRNDRTLSLTWGVMTPPTIYVDCGEEESCPAVGNNGTIELVGFDLKQRWAIEPNRRQRTIGAFLALRGGPRYVWGRDTLTGYRGVGLAVGFAFEVDVAGFGIFLDGGVTAVSMRMPADSVTGWVPSLTWGLKLGWL